MKETQLAPSPRHISPTAARTEVNVAAERRMKRGRALVMSGFAVTIVGIVGYCAACLSADINRDLGSSLMENPEWLVGPALGVIGLGTLLWFIGSFLYLSGAMDSDSDTQNSIPD